MSRSLPLSRRVPRTARTPKYGADAVATYLHELRVQAGWTGRRLAQAGAAAGDSPVRGAPGRPARRRASRP